MNHAVAAGWTDFLVAALLALVPDQPPSRLGIALIIVWVPSWGIPTFSQLATVRKREYYRLRYHIQRIVFHQAATIPLLLAGLSLLDVLSGGLAWLALALVLSMALALINAWVLLVEIMR